VHQTIMPSNVGCCHVATCVGCFCYPSPSCCRPHPNSRCWSKHVHAMNRITCALSSAPARRCSSSVLRWSAFKPKTSRKSLNPKPCHTQDDAIDAVVRFAIGSGKALLSHDDFLAVIHVIYVAHRERGGGAAPAPPSPGSLSRVRVWQCFTAFLVCLKGLAFRKRDRAQRRRFEKKIGFKIARFFSCC